MERIRHNNVVFYQHSDLRYQDGISHAVFTRRGGVSRAPYDSLNVGSTVGDDRDSVLENKTIMSGIIGVDPASVRTTWQVHGAAVYQASSRKIQNGELPKADAIITNEYDLPLEMRFADCVPLLFYDRVNRAIGLAHAGWRGTVAGVGPATVKAMKKAFGTRPSDLFVGIGPSIGPCCYEIGPEVVTQVHEAFRSQRDVLVPNGNGNNGSSHMHFDLWKANRLSLEASGVEHIESANLCTACNNSEFFSHRAEAGRTGRFGVMIVLGGDNAWQ